MADLHGPISYIEYLGEIAPHGLGTPKNRPNDPIWSHDHDIASAFETDMVASVRMSFYILKNHSLGTELRDLGAWSGRVCKNH